METLKVGTFLTRSDMEVQPPALSTPNHCLKRYHIISNVRPMAEKTLQYLQVKTETFEDPLIVFNEC